LRADADRDGGTILVDQRLQLLKQVVSEGVRSVVA
jgi:hypothetical protein